MNTSPFQLVVLGIFAVCILVGVGVFAISGGGRGNSVGVVNIWGTLDSNVVDTALQALRQNDKTFQDTHYVQRPAATYTADLVNAMAAGQGPDLFLITQEYLIPFSNKIFTIPYSSVSQATYLSSYFDEGQLFLTPQGPQALPFVVDPLVMYWNKTLFSSAGIAQPPTQWNDLLPIAQKLTTLSGSQVITRSAVALGAWSNITNAKAILSTLFMQAGDQIVGRGADGTYQATFGMQLSGSAENPSGSALRFYTDFGNPGKQNYSWNRSLPNSANAFLAGTLAVYFGFASEYATLASRNPNLQIGVATVPQLGTIASTYSRMTGVAISRSSQNPQGALAIAIRLTSQSGAAAAAAVGLVPARRDAAPDSTANAAAAVFGRSALIGRGWLDPSPAQTDALFGQMVESVTSGASTPTGAVSDAAQKLEALVPNQ